MLNKNTKAYQTKLKIIREYNTKMKHFYLAFNPNVDADVIAKIEAAPNKNDYIRQLVRKDTQD